jgi:hypothetical protein
MNLQAVAKNIEMWLVHQLGPFVEAFRTFCATPGVEGRAMLLGPQELVFPVAAGLDQPRFAGCA